MQNIPHNTHLQNSSMTTQRYKTVKAFNNPLSVYKSPLRHKGGTRNGDAH